jgi:hypothetical protein
MDMSKVNIFLTQQINIVRCKHLFKKGNQLITWQVSLFIIRTSNQHQNIFFQFFEVLTPMINFVNYA